MTQSPIVRTSTLGLVVTLTLWSSVALADNYGAIAYSQSTGRFGYAGDYGSRGSAERAALDGCGDGTCKVVLWFMNACGALATGNDGYGTGWSTSRRTAINIAMSNCNKYTSHCSLLRWQCTSR